jgi:hypothetical protein
METDKIGLVGKQIDGFFFIAKDGLAQWAHSAVARVDRKLSYVVALSVQARPSSQPCASMSPG